LGKTAHDGSSHLIGYRSLCNKVPGGPHVGRGKCNRLQQNCDKFRISTFDKEKVSKSKGNFIKHWIFLTELNLVPYI
jgi:hypothetical protein